jgi:hypothetical protein
MLQHFLDKCVMKIVELRLNVIEKLKYNSFIHIKWVLWK